MSVAIRQLTAARRERQARAEREAREVTNRAAFLAEARGAPGPKGDKGEPGKDGATPNHQWRGSKLKFEKPDGTWGKEVDLRGPTGNSGPSGGTVVHTGGGGPAWSPGSLPTATSALPEEFVVLQDGEWVRATYAQMATWLGGGTPVETGEALTSETGAVLTTETGSRIIKD